MNEIIYKISDRHSWLQAQARGVYEGSPDDRRDGYIHFSTAPQLAATLAKHFAGQRDLILAAVAVAALGDALKWEAARGGALFPHLYAPLAMDAVLWSLPLPQDDTGEPMLPEGVVP